MYKFKCKIERKTNEHSEQNVIFLKYYVSRSHEHILYASKHRDALNPNIYGLEYILY